MEFYSSSLFSKVNSNKNNIKVISFKTNQQHENHLSSINELLLNREKKDDATCNYLRNFIFSSINLKSIQRDNKKENHTMKLLKINKDSTIKKLLLKSDNILLNNSNKLKEKKEKENLIKCIDNLNFINSDKSLSKYKNPSCNSSEDDDDSYYGKKIMEKVRNNNYENQNLNRETKNDDIERKDIINININNKESYMKNKNISSKMIIINENCNLISESINDIKKEGEKKINQNNNKESKNTFKKSKYFKFCCI